MKSLTLALALVLGCAAPASAAVNVFVCEPEWGALAVEIGGDAIAVYVATTGRQDAHRVQARPSLIAKARSADLVICTGAELEIGWMPVVLRQAANPKIQPGQTGYLEAAGLVALRDVPKRLDRTEGDVHAAGNPHIQTDPRNMLPVAAEVAARLSLVDPARADVYRTRAAAFRERWSAAMRRWESAAAALRGIPIAVQHKNWTYLIDWLGLIEVIQLEPKPGVPPSTGHLTQVLAAVRATPVKMVVYAAYEDAKPAQWLSEKAGIPAVELPFTVGGSERATSLFALFDDTLDRLIKALKP